MKKLAISKKGIMLFLVFWIFYPPGYFTTAFNMAGVLNTLKYIVSIGLLFLSIIKFISKLTVLIVLIYLQLLVVTVINNGNLWDCLRYIFPPIAVTVYYEYCNQKLKRHLIHALFWIHYILMLINLFTVIFYPNGLYTVQGITTEKYYFMGHNNAAARFLLPGIFYAIICDSLDKGKIGWKSRIMAIASFITVTLTWSNTGMVGLGIVLIFILLVDRIEMPGFFTARNAFILSTILFVVVVLNNNVGVFDFVIDKVFHKDLTLSGRTYFWNAIMIAIAKNPLIGYGYGVSIADIYTTKGYVASSAHNYFFDLLLRGGIVQLILQILIVVKTCTIADKTHGKFRLLMVTVLFSYFVMWQFEPFVNTGYIDMMLVFMIISTIPALVNPYSQIEIK